MTKFQLYLLLSVTLAIAVIGRAFALRPNFWSASILLAQSNGSLILLTNVALIITGGFVWALQRLFYGPLRSIEVEQLYEKGWMAVTETLLSLTIFREDIGTRFFIMFLTLMAGKLWEWIGEGRVEFLEQQPPANPTLFHTRLSASLGLSVLFDSFMLGYCLRIILREARPGMMVMYGFEYTILTIQSVSLLLRYFLTLAEYIITKQQTTQRIAARRAEIRREREAAQTEAGEPIVAPVRDEDIEVDEHEIDVPGWEEKGRWIFYLDLVTDFVKSIVYCGFFVILLVFHGLPIHIMRDLYITVRSFIKRITDFVQYRQATKNMNERYPDATEEDLQSDNTCIICREEMSAWRAAPAEGAPARAQDERQRAKKLPCGHILHFSCLRSWLERQRVCPTCRRPVLDGVNPSDRNDANVQNAGNRGRPQNREQPGALPVAGLQANRNRGLNPNLPRPAFRVIQIGPLRIAIGAGRPHQMDGLFNAAQQQQPQHEQQNHNPDEMLAQTQYDNPPQYPMQARSILNSHASGGGLSASSTSLQNQVTQLQTRVYQQMQQLNHEHQQLDVLQRLAAELVRLQAEQGNQGANGAVLGHFQARQHEQPMIALDPNLPPGMVLPPGYTLQRLHPFDTPPVAARAGPPQAEQHGAAAASQRPAGSSDHLRNGADVSESSASAHSEGRPKSERPTPTATVSSVDAENSQSSDVRQRHPLAASMEDAPSS